MRWGVAHVYRKQRRSWPLTDEWRQNVESAALSHQGSMEMCWWISLQTVNPPPPLQQHKLTDVFNILYLIFKYLDSAPAAAAETDLCCGEPGDRRGPAAEEPTQGPRGEPGTGSKGVSSVFIQHVLITWSCSWFWTGFSPESSFLLCCWSFSRLPESSR